MKNRHNLFTIALLLILLLLVACWGGDGGGGSHNVTQANTLSWDQGNWDEQTWQ